MCYNNFGSIRKFLVSFFKITKNGWKNIWKSRRLFVLNMRNGQSCWTLNNLQVRLSSYFYNWILTIVFFLCVCLLVKDIWMFELKHFNQLFVIKRKKFLIFPTYAKMWCNVNYQYFVTMFELNFLCFIVDIIVFLLNIKICGNVFIFN